MSKLAIVNENDEEFVIYEPLDDPLCNQVAFHASNTPNLLGLGTRGTGKSTMLRFDAIMRCLMFPNFRALILRRTVPELRKSHLAFIEAEMHALGGVYLHTTMEAKFPNGSVIQFSHCEKMADVLNYLSSEWGFIGFDELSTFTLEMFLMISAAARAKEGAPYKAVVRAGSNTLGIGSAWMKQWFVEKNVNLTEFPDYHPADFEMQFSTLAGNKHINRKEYEKRLGVLPEHVRRSWLKGEFIIEGAYFTEFSKENDVTEEGVEKTIPWHCIQSMPTWKGTPIFDLPWISITRSIDWGYFPDPAVCHWHVVLPNKHKITFKERSWTRTLAKDVAQQIKRESEGMHVVESFCDPTMFVKDGAAPFSIGEIFEQNGVPLVPSQNNRELYGYAVHELLGSRIKNERGFDRPGWQILEPACPDLVRTLPILQMDAADPRKLADGPDHWVVSCAYMSMGGAVASHDPIVPTVPRWMLPKAQQRIIGVV